MKAISTGLLQFYDPNTGKPVANGYVATYDTISGSPKETFADINGSVANANPVPLDSTGSAYIFGEGSYTFVIKNQAGVNVRTIENIGVLAGGAYEIDGEIVNGEQEIATINAGAGTFTFTVSGTSGLVFAGNFYYEIIGQNKTGGSIYTPNLTYHPGQNAAPAVASYPPTLVLAAKQNIKYYRLFTIERSIDIFRVLIDIGINGRSAGQLNLLDTTVNSPNTTNYTQYQFAIYKAAYIDVVSGSKTASGLTQKLKMRYPAELIWKSDVIDTTSIRSWPNVIARSDGTYSYDGYLPVLSWDGTNELGNSTFNTTRLNRGVYFIAISRFMTGDGYGDGTPSIQSEIRNIGIASANRSAASAAQSSARWNVDSSQSISMVQPYAFSRLTALSVSYTYARESGGVIQNSLGGIAASTSITIYDTTDDTQIREFIDSPAAEFINGDNEFYLGGSTISSSSLCIYGLHALL